MCDSPSVASYFRDLIARSRTTPSGYFLAERKRSGTSRWRDATSGMPSPIKVGMTSLDSVGFIASEPLGNFGSRGLESVG